MADPRSTSMFGTSEWTVRLPAALAYGLTMVLTARLAMDWSAEPAQARRAAHGPAAIGLGFLFKYSMLAILPGLALFAWSERHVAQQGISRRILRPSSLSSSRSSRSPKMSRMLVPVSATCSATSRRAAAIARSAKGFSTVRRGRSRLSSRSARWSDPCCCSWRSRPSAAGGGDPHAARFAVLMAAPLLLIVLVTTLRAPVEGNWPIAAYVTLAPLAASMVVEERKSTARLWRATIAYGVVALAAIHAPLAVAALPSVGRYVPTRRFHGMADRARVFDRPIEEATRTAGARTLIVATSIRAVGPVFSTARMDGPR